MYRNRFFNTVLSDAGALFRFITPFTAVPLILIFIYQEWDLLIPMGLVPAIFLFLGYILMILSRDRQYSRHSTALSTIALFWLIVPIISAIPFLLATNMGYTNAFFEGMAGWTGSSFSMISDPHNFPHTLLFWRSYLQWIGGIGIVSVVLCIARGNNPFLSGKERSEYRNENIIKEIIRIARDIWVIYGILTVFAFFLVALTGVAIQDSVTLALSAVSTGGFVPHPGNIAFYNNPYLELVLIIITILSALPFPLFFLLKERRKINFFHNDQIRAMIILLTAGTILIFFNLLFLQKISGTTSIRESAFMVVSSLTTSGFQNCSIIGWEQSSFLILLILIFIGGGAVSTSGGITLRRLALVYRGFTWGLRKTFATPHILIPIKIDGERIPPSRADTEVSKNMLVIIFSILTVLIAFLMLLHIHPDMTRIAPLLFDVTSAFATCGITGGYLTTTVPDASKWIFFILMWIGRIEVMPVVILIFSIFRDQE